MAIEFYIKIKNEERFNEVCNVFRNFRIEWSSGSSSITPKYEGGVKFIVYENCRIIYVLNAEPIGEERIKLKHLGPRLYRIFYGKFNKLQGGK